MTDPQTSPASSEVADSDHTARNSHVRYERSDADFHWILGIGIASILIGAAIHVAISWLLAGYGGRQARVKSSTFPLAASEADRLPPLPRLEALGHSAGVEDRSIVENRLTEHEEERIKEAMVRLVNENRLPVRSGKPKTTKVSQGDQR
jgi:hypothetical protein